MLQGFIETFNSNTSDTTAGINSDIDLNLALSHSSVAALSDSVVQLELDSSGIENPTAVSGPHQSILVISSLSSDMIFTLLFCPFLTQRYHFLY